MRRFDSVCVLGGAGLVGYQVCRLLLGEGITQRLIIVSLGRGEVADAVGLLRGEFPTATILGRYGNVFARGKLPDAESDDEPLAFDRRDPDQRRGLLSDIYEDFDEARRQSALCNLVDEFKPSGVIDCINTATGISYQDVPTAARTLMADMGLRRSAEKPDQRQVQEDVETLLASIEIPQLILHVRLLHQAMTEAGSEVYLKVGTTGTGGMGLNIPYTHGEDKPSPTLMAKTAVAFAHTGLLFLAARTVDGPVFKELKPAAMIGYKAVEIREVPGYVWVRHAGRFVKERVDARPLFEAMEGSLEAALDNTPDSEPFSQRKDAAGRDRSLRLATVNTGENGWFAHGEFEAITALDQMEIITPEEIARQTVHELVGRSTGNDVIAAIDASILGPTFKGGLVRQVALDRITQLADEGAVPSVALGDLGPPQLSKYLFELQLMREEYETLEAAAAGLREADAADRLAARMKALPDLRDLIVSIGIPILMPDGKRILRGPEIKIPAYDPSQAPRVLGASEIDAYAAKGWVDLRTSNLEWWAGRIDHVLASRRGGSAGASDAMAHDAYGRDDFRPGEVVAWIFANEPDFRGFRIK